MSKNKLSKCYICPYKFFFKFLTFIFLLTGLTLSVIIFINFHYVYK